VKIAVDAVAPAAAAAIRFDHHSLPALLEER
jgi:hypothetical protein